MIWTFLYILGGTILGAIILLSIHEFYKTYNEVQIVGTLSFVAIQISLVVFAFVSLIKGLLLAWAQGALVFRPCQLFPVQFGLLQALTFQRRSW